jgi:integrase
MPDGRCLTEWPDFYAAIKEFAFFIRDDRYARINDAGAHTASVYALMAICHGLALDGFSSFIHVNAKVLKQFLPRIVRGNEGIIKASDRLRHWLAKRERADGQGLRSGLPLRAHKEGTAHLNTLDNARLMELARLPESACKLPRVAYLCQEASREAGLTCQTNPTAKCPEEVKLSVQALYRYLNALQLLYVMRGRIAAVSLPDRPFTNASDVAKKHGSETIPTPIPPAALALHLIAHAMLWVSNYSDPLVALWKSANDISHHNRAARYRRRNAFAELVASTPTEGPEGSPWPLSEKPVKVDSQQLSCQAAIRLLFAACFILIGTFSARRKNEVRDLTADDLDDTDVEEILLRPFIEKTLQRKDWIPVPGIVARAFRVLEALSSSARAETGCPSLFQWTNPFLARPGVMTNSMQANVAIDEFARWVKTPQWAPPGQEPTEWHWTPHQFRKFFAVLYFYRYRGATIEVLAHFLRHFNLEMTKQYLLLNPEAKHVFDQVEWGFRQQVARTIALKGDAVQGGMAKRLAKQWIDKLRTSVRITSPTVEEAEAYIDRQMRRSKLVLTPKPWVDCSCPRTTDAAKAASCRAGASIDVNTFGPDFARAGPCVCADCPFSMDNGRLEESVAEELLGAERISVSEMGAGTLLAGILKERIVKLHRYQPAAGVQGAANV